MSYISIPCTGFSNHIVVIVLPTYATLEDNNIDAQNPNNTCP